jgi:hypothetical protein
MRWRSLSYQLSFLSKSSSLALCRLSNYARRNFNEKTPAAYINPAKGSYHCVRLQKTHASHALQDDVPGEVKQRRLEELISAFREEAAKVNSALVGTTQLVLVEGVSTAAAARLTITCRPDGHKGVDGRHCVMTLDGG